MWFNLHLQLPWWRHNNVTSSSFNLELKMVFEKVCKTGTPH
jgi:hypothetical protein